ncbi:MAG TPA: DUF1737 domain-containing protein [Pyrinomonadaceae bacterium]|nr:DUF1737 domain-containing protein [Pyrinomonadaceae bacterium]
MKYTIVEGSNVKELVEKVNKAIQEGWKPQGGMACKGSDYDRVYQAMVRS